MTVVPPPVPLPVRRLLVPAWTLVAALFVALVMSTVMFALGRSAQRVLVAGGDPAAPLGALVRVDTALAAGDAALGRQLLEQIALPAGPAAEAAVALRRKAIAGIEAAAAVKVEQRSPAAVAKRLANRLHRLDQAGLVLAPPSVPAPTQPAQPPAPLEPITLAGEPAVPLARIVHPGDPQRAYALHPAKGLVLSSDGGATWRSGLPPLAALTGTALAFSSDPQPLLLVIGAEIWAFADDDPDFFPAGTPR